MTARGTKVTARKWFRTTNGAHGRGRTEYFSDLKMDDIVPQHMEELF